MLKVYLSLRMMPNILMLCLQYVYMCVSLAIIAESYAQMFVIFDKFYQRVEEKPIIMGMRVSPVGIF